MTRRGAKRLMLSALCLFGVLLFSALGLWQLERRRWKVDLIDRVAPNINAPAIALPDRLPGNAQALRALEYRRVSVAGTFLHHKETLVGALTERGAGYWVVTPLRTATGTILVNRGFVPAERADPRSHAAVSRPVRIEGLARLTEPRGRFLRPNRPAEDRWYSRDVAAIAARRGLGLVAPLFIDADATPNPGGLPIGGLTVVRFRNTHLIYALTWFGLAALSLAGLVLLRRGAQDGA